MAAPGDVMNSGLNDPVTKAVVDNIMGNLPTKKPLVRCDECDLTFTSQTVLDTHLQGARHAKQIRSKNIMASLEETKVSFTKAGETNGLKCDVCNVCLNSIQQLQTHLNGSRHKKKASQGGRNKREDGPQDVPVKPAPKKKETNNKPIIQYSCDLCNKFFNSSSQYDMHIMSKKHLDKERNANKPPGQKKRFFPYWKRAKSNNQYPTRIDNQYPTNRVQQYDLSNSFVHGGYTNMV